MRSRCDKPLTRLHGRQRRTGFVLVMSLVLIAVAAISLAGIARRSLELARQAAMAKEDLQRRWGTLSCQRLLLEQAESYLERQAEELPEVARGWPLPAAVSGSFILGGLQFDVLLADEDAKVNLNTVYRRAPENVHQVASDMLHASAANGLGTRVLLPSGRQSARAMSPFRSWGQVFEPVGANNSIEVGQAIRNATGEITCWGSGRLNIRRASDEAVRLVCEGRIASDVLGELLAIRGEPGIADLDSLLRSLTLKSRDRARLRQLMTDHTQCHSLWIVAHSQRRSWTTLVVDRPGEGVSADQQMFTW